jgi:hypothetical protein
MTGARDDTAGLLPPLKQRFGPLQRVVTHERNRGYRAALRSGFEAATKEFVFYTDGGGQYDLRELPKLLDLSGTNDCGISTAITGWRGGR